ncbi:MAG TPA: hypothetical protein VGH87_00170 [Polyangiaceae bacterium]
MKASGSATGVIAALALVVRAAIVWWAHAKFPPVADATYYDLFARRLAEGLGYTMAWPDGVVTYAAHYPVGYPGILSIAYRVFGESLGVAMGVNAVIGAASAAAAHRLALREAPAGFAAGAAIAIALHPALLLYVPALMTESVATSLAIIALACAPHETTGKTDAKYMQYARIAAMGVFFGIATLVRPQMIAFAPLLAFVVTRRLPVAGLVLAVALVTVAPWTARNCVRMNRCALVSVNGGWNLLIGVHTENGSWTPLDTPPECREVWDEAGKDACFERAARREIARSPRAWLSKIPRKLSMTFDVFAAGPYYLHRSNPRAFDVDATVITGGIETFASRLFLALSFVACVPLFRLRVSRKDWVLTAPRFALALVGLVFAFIRTAWPAYAILAVLCFVRARGERRSMLRVTAGIVVAATMATHAVFFGAGRYGLLVVPFVALSAFACVRPKALAASRA